MKQVWKVVEAEAYERARKQPLTQRLGKPTRTDWIMWQKELEKIAAVYDVSDSYKWTIDANGNNYGCLALAVDPVNGGPDYELRTGITTYVAPIEPPHYNAAININTPTYLRKQMEEENEQMKHDFFTWKGAERGLAENLRDAMGEQYYGQLEHSIVGFKNVTMLQIMKHLDEEWVPMNTKERKKIKADYYKPWDVAGGVALSAFTKALDERKQELVQHNITIDEEDVKEHYMGQMYASNVFNETDMKEWERKSEADKEDWTIMKKYFRDKMALNEAYNNNNEGNAATLYGSSANVTEEQEEKLADMGDQIREYIQQLTGEKENKPPPAYNKPTTSNNNANEEINKRMTKIEGLLTALTLANSQNNRNSGGENDEKRDDKDNKQKKRTDRRRDTPMLLYRNMGGYCHSCGFHPVGKEHTSMTCQHKRANHNDNATWSNRGANASVVWPVRVREDQKCHESWAGKSAPTN